MYKRKLEKINMFHYRKLTKYRRDHNAGNKGQESYRAYRKANTLKQVAK